MNEPTKEELDEFTKQGGKGVFISRTEAIEISRKTLERAERERQEVNEHETIPPPLPMRNNLDDSTGLGIGLEDN